MSRPSRTAIVLAGGRSTRFGADKLAAPLDGGTVLAATIAAVAGIVDGVLVAGPSLPAGFEAGDVPTALVHDPEPFGGPLVALAHVLGTAHEDPGMVALVVAGDMPRLVPSVLAAMLETLEGDPRVEAVVLGAAEAPSAATPSEPPRRQVLPLAVRVQPAAGGGRAAVEAGHRSLQALLDRMTAIELPPSAWRPLDPEGLTLLDVDTTADLDRLRAR